MIKLYKITIWFFKDIHNITLKQNVQILPIIQTKINYHSKKKKSKQQTKSEKKSGQKKQIKIIHSISRGRGKEKVIN